MSRIKMILTDLDATLLNDDKQISDYTLSIINKARAQGIKFVPATARAQRVLKRMSIYEMFPSDAIICLNGSRILLNDEVIYEQGMSVQERDEVMRILINNYPGYEISLEMNDVFYANYDVSKYDKWESNYILTDFSDLPDNVTTRIIMDIGSIDLLPKLEEALPSYMYAHCIEGRSLCRILHKEVTKAKSIEFLCHLWNLQQDEIVCFGDDSNDIQMFDYCGISVAMENAIEDVKSRATHITLSNNEDGVAKWIEENIFK